MGIEPRSKTRRLSPEPRKDSMAPVFVRSKNRNEVRPKTFVAGPIARSPSPATGAGKGKDPARQQPGAQQAHLSGYAGGLNGSTQQRPEVQSAGVSMAKFVRER
jgi:hypothetical protein